MRLPSLMKGCFWGVSVSGDGRCDVSHDDGEVHSKSRSFQRIRLSRKGSRRQIIEAEEEKARQAKLDEEAMAKYLGSGTAMKRVESNTSMCRSQTPERKTKGVVMMFDDDGNVVMKGRSVKGSDAESVPKSDASAQVYRMLSTPERSDYGQRQETSESGDDVSWVDGEQILHRVYNHRAEEPITESCFKELAENYDGDVVGRTLVKEVGSIRRNMSWSHFSEISLRMPSTQSENAFVNRRHTVLVLTNEDDLEDDINETTEASVAGESNAGSVHRKLSNIYDHHHVHLSKLQEQMGDSSKPPEDLLELMARKVFTSHASLVDVEESAVEIEDSVATSNSHDLSECSAKLPKIKTR
eukprot:CAMPEP_0118807686 /NCGR_PEP_ID=MMETSP1161-20130426/35602_1 /TAXON_ID=249345 /ORGANISM="Picochlorum oklahomensis, Strain CCMP2329" /LENGTH=354 /DNA_ID=CAMNT_0006737067 /DNA_START=342 /DNA_END=1406 /DNA_ORIENTATION=+